MKKNLLFLCMLVGMLGVFAACSDDDDKVVYPIDDEIAGTYKGTLDISLDGQTIGSGLPKNIIISKAGDASIDMELKDFSFLGMELGTITLYDCEVNKSGNSYLFTGQQVLNVSQYSLTGDINVQGSVTGNSVTVNLDITAQLGGLSQAVKVVYQGTRLSGSESSEAKILGFTFDSEVVIDQPVIDDEAGTIVFTVNADAEDLRLAPVIEVSENAVVTPASGVAQNFGNNNKVTYTVIAEDGTTKTYIASIAGLRKVLKYSFENWNPGVEDDGELGAAGMIFYEPEGWSSSNTGAHFLKAFSLADKYVVTETDDAHDGKSAVRIQSIDTKGRDMFLAKAPKVTSGSLFLGTFVTDIQSTLNSTKFGIPFSQKPLLLKGWYKYTPGADYYIVPQEPYADHCHESELDNSKTDQFAISIVLYETDAFKDDYSDCLTGVSGENGIYSSSRIAAIGQLFGGEQKEWKNFELSLDWKKEYDETKLYRLAILCSSSKDGDKFWGAPESTLIVDDFELICE